MDGKHILAGALGVLVVAGVGAAVLFGVGPAPGGDGASGEDTPTMQFTDTVVVGGDTESGADGTATGNGGGTAEGGTTTDAAETVTTTPPPPFTFRITNIEKCGSTCRDVTVTLSNNQNHAAEDVVVVTKIFTDGDKIWQGREDVGRMAADTSVTRTQRVKLSYSEGIKVKQNDGWITIKTYVSTSEHTFVFKRRRDVTD